MNDKKLDYTWDAELSDREVFLLGKIVAQWGALEHEVFTQTFLSFKEEDGEDAALPKAMNNIQFTKVLDLWEGRVAEKAEGERAEVLRAQLEEIRSLQDYRNALMHGMWEWSPDDLSRITAIRIRKNEVISTHFSADDLQEFYSRLSLLNFKIRYPGGVEDLNRKRAGKGFYISRLGMGLSTGHSVAADWLTEGRMGKGSPPERGPDRDA